METERAFVGEIDCEIPRQEFNEQVIGFCLRGLGLKEEAILRRSKDIGTGET